MTLVEVMIALALLAIIAIGAMGTFSSLLTANRANTASTQLQTETQKVMESLRSVAFDALPSWHGTVLTSGNITIAISVVDLQPNLLRQIEVAGSQPGRTGGTFSLVTLRSARSQK